MAVDKLVDSTQLDSDITSIANAIRTKSGTSGQLSFPSDFITAISNIPSGGSGLRYASGTITIDSQTNIPPTVTHNLGTKKVFAIWWLEKGTVLSSYNRFAWQTILNWWDIIPDDYYITANNTTDCYFDKTKSTSQMIVVVNKTDLTGNAQALASDGFDITDNTLQLKGAYYTVWGVGTYHWVVIALDDVLPTPEPVTQE